MHHWLQERACGFRLVTRASVPDCGMCLHRWCRAGEDSAYTDTYNASKAIYHVGPAAPAPAPAETTTPETTQVEPTPDQGPKGPGEIGPDSQNPAAG